MAGNAIACWHRKNFLIGYRLFPQDSRSFLDDLNESLKDSPRASRAWHGICFITHRSCLTQLVRELARTSFRAKIENTSTLSTVDLRPTVADGDAKSPKVGEPLFTVESPVGDIDSPSGLFLFTNCKVQAENDRTGVTSAS
jgi:hypothetical protein